MNTNDTIMKNLKKWFLLGLFSLGLFHAGYAVPAYPGKLKVKQADGSVIMAYLYGDEYGHQMFTSDGYPIVYNETTGNYEFAQLRNNNVVCSGVVASDESERSAEAESYLKTIDTAAFTKLMNKRIKANRVAANRIQAAHAPRKVTTAGLQSMRISDVPTTGNQKALVVLVQFSDKKFTTDDETKQLWTDKLNKVGYTENGATGSAFDYFNLCSNGLYSPDFVTVGPVTLSHTCYYYGGNDDSGSDNFQRLGEMIEEACNTIADSIDFSEFDTDSDGYVDNIYFIYAGYGEADSYYSSTIWPHSYYYSSICTLYPDMAPLKIDSVTIDRYTMSQEINGQTNDIVGMGTFIHEFGHVLGLADHYNTANSSADGQLGEWDVEAAGSYNNNQNTPPLYSAFERASLGWLDIPQLSANAEGYIDLPCLADSNFAYCVSIPDNDNEFFLLENRQQKGWDAYLPGHGLLVWHVDYDASAWTTNSVNTDVTHQRLDIVEADGSTTSTTTSGDAFPGTGNVDEFDFFTWDDDTLFSFADVREDSEAVAFLLGGPQLIIPSPRYIEVSDLAGKSMNLAWSAVDYAKSYNLRVIADSDTTTYESIADTMIALTGLQPETTYTLQVCANIGKYSSEWKDSTVTTLPLQFFEQTVIADDATNITGNSFSANWEPLEGATDYCLTVYQKTTIGSADVSFDFTESVDSMPQGWSANTTSTGHTLYGESSPSLRLSKEDQYLEFDAIGDSLIQEVKFWWAGNKAGNDIYVQYANNNDDWTTIDILTTDDVSHEADYSFDGAGKVRIYSLRNLGSGYVCLDDVTCTYMVVETNKLEGYDSVSVGNVTSYQVTQLDTLTAYSYKVVATDGTYVTPASNEINLKTISGVVDAIEEISTSDVITECFDLTGKKVNINSVPQGVYLVRKGDRIYKILKK